MEKLLHYYRNSADPEGMANKVLAAIEWLGPKWVGLPAPKGTDHPFVFKRSGGMFGSGLK